MMKNYLIGLSLFVTVFSVAQVSVKNRYSEAAKKARIEFDSVYADELAELTDTSDLQRIYKTLDPSATPVDNIITNDAALPQFLTEFYNSAIYHRVDYARELITLQKVVLIEAELNFLGSVVEIEGGQEVWLNSKLLLYPNLMRAIFYHEMGVLYDIPEDKNSQNLDFMSDRWEINPKFEHWAYNRRQRSTQKGTFFEKLRKKHPLKKQL
jgi:hypothetical protein